MTACLTDIFCSREKISGVLLVFLFFQITYSKTVKINQICYSQGYLYILTGFEHVPFTSGTCRLPCCQMKFVFVYFVLTYNCNLCDETNIFFLPFPDPVRDAFSTSVFLVGLSFLKGCLSIYRQCGFYSLFSIEGNK